MARRRRSFTVADVLRIIEEHLSAVEREEVRFTIKTGRIRSAFAKGLDPETPRQIETLLRRMVKLRGGAR